MTYAQLTSKERYTIFILGQANHCPAAIAKVLGRSRSTVTREIARNTVSGDGGYLFGAAQKRTDERRRDSRYGLHHTKSQYRRVDDLLAEDWSPEQISGRLKYAHEFEISYETIYRHIWADQAAGGLLYLGLRGARKKQRKGYGRPDSRGKLAGKRMIDERPAHIETRKEIGHWEIDTVIGKDEKDCIMTVVERKVGHVLIGKLPDRTKAELNKRTIKIIKQHPGMFETITADNGTEFNGYKKIESATSVKFYFAHPYHSWERGTNENTNGLIRQYIPKGQSMANVTQRQCSEIARRLNTRPRKRLGYRTPEECFNGR